MISGNFPSVLGLTSPMAFPEVHFSSPAIATVPSIFPTNVPSLSYLLSTLLSISSWVCLSLHHHLPAVSQFSLSNTTHLFSQHDQTISACFIASLQQCHQLPACSSHTHYFSFHLNSLLSTSPLPLYMGTSSLICQLSGIASSFTILLQILVSQSTACSPAALICLNHFTSYTTWSCCFPHL